MAITKWAIQINFNHPRASENAVVDPGFLRMFSVRFQLDIEFPN